MSPSEITDALNAVSSVENVEQLKLLEVLIHELQQSSLIPEQYVALFGLLERFPEHDGFGLFWSILHLLERDTQYLPFLLESVWRQPADFNLRMIARLINSGATNIGQIDLVTLLRSISASSAVSESARAFAHDFVRQCEV